MSDVIKSIFGQVMFPLNISGADPTINIFGQVGYINPSTSSPSGWSNDFNGVANASISKINGVAIASIAKVNGI